MRIVFIGQENVGHDALVMLFKEDYEVVGAITMAKSPDIANYCSFKTLNLPCPLYTLTDPSEDMGKILKGMKPDLIIVVGWSWIIPKEILEMPSMGVIGIHYSLLPNRRGGAPVAWALIDGLDNTGVTLFYYTEKIDAGDIIAQRVVEIGNIIKPDTLLRRMGEASVRMLKDTLPLIERGIAPRIPQDESKATYTKKRTPKDSFIVTKYWTKRTTLKQFYDYLRALDDPYPHAHIRMGNKRFEFNAARLSDDGKTIYCACKITEVEDGE